MERMWGVGLKGSKKNYHNDTNVTALYMDTPNEHACVVAWRANKLD
jgi:hypothetical protein